jgi:D-alanine-D-alanine ligase
MTAVRLAPYEMDCGYSMNRVDSLDVVLLVDGVGEFGQGSDRDKTLLAASEVVEAIEPSLVRLGHRPRRMSFTDGIAQVVARLDAVPPDVVFLLGRPVPSDPAGDAQVAALLDLLGLAHTSESPETLLLARDKVRAKALFAHHQIKTPPYAVAVRGDLPDELPPRPWIVKPTLEDGSVGLPCLSPATDRGDLAVRVRSLYDRLKQPILIETYFGGREFQVGIVGLELLPIVEIAFLPRPQKEVRLGGHETNWKYEGPEFRAAHYTCPARVSDSLATRIRQLACQTAAAFGIQRCCRVDIRMDDRDELCVLDVNPSPDLSSMATMHRMAQVTGWGFDGIVRRLVTLAHGGRPRGR